MNEPATPKRRSREDLKQLVMDAALEVIRAEGLGAEPTTLTYQRVFDHLEVTKGVRVTRASVHERIWDSQHQFQLEVLSELGPWNIATPESVIDPAMRVLRETEGRPTIERMREVTRIAAQATQAASESDPLYYTWVGMTMMLARDASLDQPVIDALTESVRVANQEIVQRTGASIRAIGEILGVRPSSALFEDEEEGWRILVNLGAALSEGVTLRTRFDQAELPNTMLATGPNGELQEWSAFAAGYWALLHTFIEIDPNAPTVQDTDTPSSDPIT